VASMQQVAATTRQEPWLGQSWSASRSLDGRAPDGRTRVPCGHEQLAQTAIIACIAATAKINVEARLEYLPRPRQWASNGLALWCRPNRLEWRYFSPALTVCTTADRASC
jgi:hypothetical protein